MGPHRLTEVHYGGSGSWWTYQWDARGNQTVRDAPGTVNDRTIRYSLDDHAHEIETGNGKRTRYWYGPDGQRYKREDIDGTKTLYIGQVEVVINASGTTYRRNIQGVLIKTEGAQPQDNRFIFTDRLGSVVKYTNGGGDVVYQPQDYDEWGQRRDYDDPTAVGAAPTPPIGLRGYTGHEMVDGQGVIHMNARLYDPMLGRFLQADPMIEAPENLQSWNAYTYVFNNPLTLVDPTGMSSIGKLLRTIVAIVITVYTGGAAAGLWSFFGAAITAGSAAAYGVAALGGFAAGAIQTGSLRGGLIGAVSALAFYGVGQLGNAMNASDILRAGMHGMAGGILESLQGGNFGDGFLSAGLSKLTMSNIDTGSMYGDATLTALAGGAISQLTGGKFANGALTSAMQFAFNQVGQKVAARQRAEAIRSRIAEIAKKYVDSDEWAFGKEKGPYGSGTNKCNLFVYDVLSEAGAGSSYMNGGVIYNLFGIGEPEYPVLAGQWGDPDFKIPGWEVVKGAPMPGDVVAEKSFLYGCEWSCRDICSGESWPAPNNKCIVVYANSRSQ